MFSAASPGAHAPLCIMMDERVRGWGVLVQVFCQFVPREIGEHLSFGLPEVEFPPDGDDLVQETWFGVWVDEQGAGQG